MYLSTFFFSFNPARFEDCARQRAALPWQRRHPEFQRQEKVHIEVKLSLQEQKSAPLQALEEGLKGQASVTLRKKAFFFSFVTDVTKRTNRKIDMVNERTASTHLLRRLASRPERWRWQNAANKSSQPGIKQPVMAVCLQGVVEREKWGKWLTKVHLTSLQQKKSVSSTKATKGYSV